MTAGFVPVVSFADEVLDANSAQLPSVQEFQEPGLAANSSDTGLIISGGKEGIDYEIVSSIVEPYTNPAIVIKTNTKLTFGGTAKNGYGIAVKPGTHANIVLAGVHIEYPLELDAMGGIPINIVTNVSDVGGKNEGSIATSAEQITNQTSLHITIKDGTVNTLIAGTNAPGIHCGEGSVLIIDDEVKNYDSQGNRITPKEGAVPYDCVLSNGTKLQKGDPLYLLESKNPGKLISNGGALAAGIGSGRGENSGVMIFDGGIIQAESYGSKTDVTQLDNAGAGIGGGIIGGTLRMEFNGGTVKAISAAHGPGIGAGHSGLGWGLPQGWDKPLIPSVIKSDAPNGVIMRDLYVNGGDVQAIGHIHGHSIGSACVPADNACQTIFVTGGNLTLSNDYGVISGPNGEFYSGYIGAPNIDIEVTGGSFFVPPDASGTPQFSGVATDGKGNKLTMVKIDLGVNTEYKGQRVKDLNVKIDGVSLPDRYGLPCKIDDEGVVYFWLPETIAGKQVSVSDFTVYDPATGKETTSPSDFILPSGNAGGVAKRYVMIDANETIAQKPEIAAKINKRYDGIPISQEMILPLVAELQLRIDNPVSAVLHDVNHMEFVRQRLTNKTGESVSEAQVRGDEAAYSNAGSYAITVEDREYAASGAYPEFGDSYWGHWVLFDSVIEPADSEVYDVGYAYKDAIAGEGGQTKKGYVLSASVRPRSVKKDDLNPEATTCAAPDGAVSFYVNGVCVGTANVAKQGGTSKGYAWSKAELFWDPERVQVPKRSDGKLIARVVFDNATNYNPSSYADDDPGIPTQPDLPYGKLPEVALKPDEPGKPPIKLEQIGEIESKDPDPDAENKDLENSLHVKVGDTYREPIKEGAPLRTPEDLQAWAQDRYTITPGCEIGLPSITTPDGTPVEGIDPTKPGSYIVTVPVRDPETGNTTTVVVDYQLYDPQGGQPPYDPDTPQEPNGPQDPIEPSVPTQPTEPNDPDKPDDSGDRVPDIEETITITPGITEPITPGDIDDYIKNKYDDDPNIKYDKSPVITIVRDGVDVDCVDPTVPGTYVVTVIYTGEDGSQTVVRLIYVVEAPQESSNAVSTFIALAQTGDRAGLFVGLGMCVVAACGFASLSLHRMRTRHN